MLTAMKPTLDFYSYLQSAFDFFNQKLFNNELSYVMFTITRKKNVFGYFRKDGWVTEAGGKVHEIAMNPAYFITASPLELYQTLVHEMCHQWQHEHGKPSRSSYHNKEWADKMQAIGLMPIAENGGVTGQKVGDKPISAGRFEKSCKEFFTAGYRLALVDRQYNNEVTLKRLNEILDKSVASASTPNLINADDSIIYSEIDLTQPLTDFYSITDLETTQPMPSYPIKTCYQCPNCEYKVWGRLGLPLGCLDCNTTLMIIKEGT